VEKTLAGQKFSYMSSDSKEEERQVYDLIHSISSNRELNNVLSIANILKHSPLKKEQRNAPKREFVWGCCLSFWI
jgi:hypothetical protein